MTASWGYFMPCVEPTTRRSSDYHNDLDDAAMSLRLGFPSGEVWVPRLIGKRNSMISLPHFCAAQGAYDYHQEVMALKRELEQPVPLESKLPPDRRQQQQLVSLNGYIAILEDNKRPRRKRQHASQLWRPSCHQREPNWRP